MANLFDRLQSALGDTYRLERELGGGGMSRVYLATEKALNRKVVIKLLPPEMAAGVNIDRFEREIQLVASLQHPHVVPLLTAGSHDDLRDAAHSPGCSGRAGLRASPQCGPQGYQAR